MRRSASRLGALCVSKHVRHHEHPVALAMLLRTLVRPSLISRQLPRHVSGFSRTMSITHISNASQLDGILAKSKDKLSVSISLEVYAYNH